MSGKYPARVGVTQYIPGHAIGRLQDVPYFHGLPIGEYSIARALGDGGYQTWHVGKWHLGGARTTPERHGFEVNIAGLGWGMPQNGYFSPYGMANLPDGEEGEYLTDRLTDEAIRLIEARDASRPFFLNLAHYAVHIPIQPPPGLVDKYRQRAADMGLDKQDVIVEGEPFGCEHLHGERVLRRIRQSDAAYAAMVENLDANIGRVLVCLSEQGLDDNTLVLFTSDNGGLATSNRREGVPTSNAPLAEGKGWMYEGGTRVCQMARLPGMIEPGSVLPGSGDQHGSVSDLPRGRLLPAATGPAPRRRQPVAPVPRRVPRLPGTPSSGTTRTTPIRADDPPVRYDGATGS